MTASMCAPMAMAISRCMMACHSNPPPTPPVQDLLAPTPRPRSPPNLTVLLEIFAPSPPQTTHTMMPTTCCHSSGARISRPVLPPQPCRAEFASLASSRLAAPTPTATAAHLAWRLPNEPRPFRQTRRRLPTKMSSPSQACLSLDDAASQNANAPRSSNFAGALVAPPVAFPHF
ncbi:hypothetical protein IWX90DRAFT_185339 [Phyllosticta citrichinensis]|uniref:Uncharacterized protein n=1 Tax=Phyllosticta citrichinensis TaxID=1130410 RepID=A0ABR1XW89_9PEZI